MANLAAFVKKLTVGHAGKMDNWPQCSSLSATPPQNCFAMWNRLHGEQIKFNHRYAASRSFYEDIRHHANLWGRVTDCHLSGSMTHLH